MFGHQWARFEESAGGEAKKTGREAKDTETKGWILDREKCEHGKE
jgi:hypothetical protein